MHRRYDAFLEQRGLSPAQADRFVELQLQQADIRQDLQDSIREEGLIGGTRGVEALRSKLYQPIQQELRQLLGEDGLVAFRDYERTSYYREGFVAQITPMFALDPLSPQQTEQLVRLVAANDHPQRLKPTDLGTESLIDWNSVTLQASNTLSPAQIAVLRAYAAQKTAK
jgi:hypothetical protein